MSIKILKVILIHLYVCMYEMLNFYFRDSEQTGYDVFNLEYTRSPYKTLEKTNYKYYLSNLKWVIFTTHTHILKYEVYLKIRFD